MNRQANIDHDTDIACISYATLIITATSICQQFYDFAFWVDILTDQFYFSRENADNAEVQYNKGSRGIKLALSYVRKFENLSLAARVLSTAA
ncbi:uncharacterized protein ColSpa_06426 [Colletotrichum spaethianum]|uniref:Uncharacterized protein n=1 Tax=Colletotrichum spaethianum TaxID=700344 RepID=A0AA37LGR7_9PEZI|nr:uncharacterized protein ColSpa_06426 [Colletotrichum spaethianum]GKT46245.1 hypothetical protein ColSpa_06426 [Colletotrichum spaethianum]